MEEVSLFSLTSRSRMVAVRHLPLPADHILNCHIKKTNYNPPLLCLHGSSRQPRWQNVGNGCQVGSGNVREQE